MILPRPHFYSERCVAALKSFPTQSRFFFVYYVTLFSLWQLKSNLWQVFFRGDISRPILSNCGHQIGRWDVRGNAKPTAARWSFFRGFRDS